jgi:hypothetical protein
MWFGSSSSPVLTLILEITKPEVTFHLLISTVFNFTVIDWEDAMVEWLPKMGGGKHRSILIFLPNDPSQTLLDVTCLLQKIENSHHDLLIVAVWWCHWPKPPEISISCLFLDLNAKGIKTSGKTKRELKMLCKHQDNVKEKWRFLGEEVKG